MNIISKFKQDHWPVFLVSLLSAIVNLFLPIILVRLLTPADIGLYKVFFLYAQSIVFITLAGGPLYSVYYFVGKKENTDQYLSHAWILNFGISAFFTLIGFIFINPISAHLLLSKELTFLLILSSLTSGPSGFYGEYLVAKGSRITGSIFNSGFEILKAIVILLLVYITRDVKYALYGFSILFTIKLALSLILSNKAKLINFFVDRKIMNEVIKYCTPISTAGLFSFIVEKIDMIILSSRLDPTHFAFYSMGSLVVPPLLILESSVQKVLVPNLSLEYHRDNFKQMIHHYKKAQNDIALIMIPAVFGLLIFNRPIIEILFTEKYMESAIFLKIYAFTYLTYIIPHDSIPRASGNTHWVLKLYLIITPLSIGTVYFCAGKFGAVGALTSSIVFMYFPKIPGLMYSSKITKHSILDLIALRSFTYYFVINAILTIICFLTKSLFPSEKIWFLVLGPLYVITYFTIFHFTKQMKKGY